MNNYFLGLDYGTGSCKGCIINEAGDVVSYSNREYEIITAPGGISEHDARLYWPLTCEIIRECIDKAGAVMQALEMAQGGLDDDSSDR